MLVARSAPALLSPSSEQFLSAFQKASQVPNGLLEVLYFHYWRDGSMGSALPNLRRPNFFRIGR